MLPGAILMLIAMAAAVTGEPCADVHKLLDLQRAANAALHSQVELQRDQLALQKAANSALQTQIAQMQTQRDQLRISQLQAAVRITTIPNTNEIAIVPSIYLVYVTAVLLDSMRSERTNVTFPPKPSPYYPWPTYSEVDLAQTLHQISGIKPMVQKQSEAAFVMWLP